MGLDLIQMRIPEIDWQPVSRVQLIFWTVFYGLLLLYLALNWGQLTLVTVGGVADESQHDWVRIFTRLRLLPHAIQIGNFTRLVAWAGMVGSVAWLAWRGYRGGVAGVES